jgi:hypothetical protein
MEKILTLEFDEKDEVIELHLNKKGAEFLLAIINSLISQDSNDHSHLMTSNWGGDELSSVKQNLGNDVKLLNHLKVIYWND